MLLTVGEGRIIKVRWTGMGYLSVFQPGRKTSEALKDAGGQAVHTQGASPVDVARIVTFF